jgi:hypothetical protein
VTFNQIITTRDNINDLYKDSKSSKFFCLTLVSYYINLYLENENFCDCLNGYDKTTFLKSNESYFTLKEGEKSFRHNKVMKSDPHKRRGDMYFKIIPYLLI